MLTSSPTPTRLSPPSEMTAPSTPRAAASPAHYSPGEIDSSSIKYIVPFKITAAEGKGNGESLRQFPLKPQDYVLVDRGYCHASGIHYAAGRKAYLAVRLNPDGILLQAPDGSKFGLLQGLKSITATGQMEQWEVLVPFEDHAPVSARLCVVRKSQTAIALAQKKLRRYASKHGTQLQAETLVYAQYVMVLTTFPAPEFSLQQVLDHYRFRRQIELVFKRFKQIAQLGHLPKYDQDSAKAWLYGKLFVTLLTEKLIQHARAISPWGYPLARPKCLRYQVGPVSHPSRDII